MQTEAENIDFDKVKRNSLCGCQVPEIYGGPEYALDLKS